MGEERASESGGGSTNPSEKGQTRRATRVEGTVRVRGEHASTAMGIILAAFVVDLAGLLGLFLLQVVRHQVTFMDMRGSLKGKAPSGACIQTINLDPSC